MCIRDRLKDIGKHQINPLVELINGAVFQQLVKIKSVIGRTGKIQTVALQLPVSYTHLIMNYPDATDPTSLHGKLAKLLKEDYLDQGKTCLLYTSFGSLWADPCK